MTGGGPRQSESVAARNTSKRGLAGENEQQNPRPAKRSRVTRACDQCRATREKCDGIRPTCGTCASQERECFWEEKPKRRGITPNYIRTLELTLAWIFDNFSECEFLLSNNLPASGSTCFRLISAQEADPAEALHQRWRNGVVARQIEQLLSGAPVEPGLKSKPNEGHGSRILEVSAIASKSPESNPSEDGLTTGLRESAQQQDTSNTTTRDEGLLTLPEDTWALLEYYFAFTHAWLPFVSKQDILKLVYSFPANGLSAQDEVPPEYARLWCVLAVSETQMISHGNEKIQISGVCDVAKRLIPLEHSSLRLEHFDCLLLLAIAELTRGSALSAWIWLGSALRLLSFPHGINKASTSPQWSQIQRSRFAAHVLESALAYRLQTTPQSSLDQANQGNLVSEDGDEEWAPWRDPLHQSAFGLAKSPSKSFSTFNSLIRLALQAQSSTEVQDLGTSSRLCEIVFTLIDNPVKTQGRRQPSSVVAEFWHKPIFTTPAVPTDRPQVLSGPRNGLGASPQVDPTAVSGLLDQRHHASISIPHDLSPPNPGDAVDAINGQGRRQDPSSARPTLAMSTSKKDGNTTNDLFEELASLESTELGDGDQFMNNLGFGPELDLMEFFGSDYQPSDPFLAQMQASLMNSSNSGNVKGR
ncbi:hypothetical protein K431DRAFT_281472 [Polychaeton citri CBS 116435]|uniref:Zn(2)-C6 fungal-type domain-containing protein n=1 Tax=Polychaeton citri CBS 116435 TaxID=1314669 RepID=A0A9P4UTQ9_9PEZI|nr:hypothetical protein K431DRAFT_281472 [Polychaeton citri CBS 116435]